MRNFAILFLLIFAITKTQSQNFQISFTGTGASTFVDSVKVENLTQCNDTILAGSNILHLTDLTAGIIEVSNNDDNTLQIFPNPNSGSCTIDFESAAQSNTTFGLFDITGKRILYKQELLTKGYQTYSLSGIYSGVYFLKIESGDYSYVSKIVSSNFSNTNTIIKHIETKQGTDKKTTVSNTEETVNLKSGKSVIDMQYNTGDIIKLTGKSGAYRTVFIIVPSHDTTITFNFIACTDADSNHYAVVQIGTQIWMGENLKTTKYSNGAYIPDVIDTTIWLNLTSGARCYYNNDSAANDATYGAFYNWYAVNNSLGIAPQGWHVASDAEWNIMEKYLDSSVDTSATNWSGIDVGGYLKEKCSSLWFSSNIATDSSGFSALPGGYRNYTGGFFYLGDCGWWWSSTENLANAWNRGLKYNNTQIFRHDDIKIDGFSVRCVKD